jgi:hypothetical protein
LSANHDDAMSDTSDSRSKGCLFYGCLTLVVLAIAGVIGAVFAIRAAPKLLANRYTAAAPVPIPQSELSDADYETLLLQLETHAGDYERTNAFSLTLTGPQLNALLQRHPSSTGLKNHLHVAIEGDRVIGTLSLPLDKFADQAGWKSVKGRYLNGKGAFKLALKDGALLVHFDSLEVNGKPVPALFMAEMRKQNMADEFNRNPRNAEFFARFESIEIKDGQVVIQVRGADPARAAPAP